MRVCMWSGVCTRSVSRGCAIVSTVHCVYAPTQTSGRCAVNSVSDGVIVDHTVHAAV